MVCAYLAFVSTSNGFPFDGVQRSSIIYSKSILVRRQVKQIIYVVQCSGTVGAWTECVCVCLCVEEESEVCIDNRHNEIRTRRTDPIYFIADGAHNGTAARVEKK